MAVTADSCWSRAREFGLPVLFGLFPLWERRPKISRQTAWIAVANMGDLKVPGNTVSVLLNTIYAITTSGSPATGTIQYPVGIGGPVLGAHVTSTPVSEVALPGSTVPAGTFAVRKDLGVTESIGSVTISANHPTLFSAMTLSGGGKSHECDPTNCQYHVHLCNTHYATRGWFSNLFSERRDFDEPGDAGQRIQIRRLDTDCFTANHQEHLATGRGVVDTRNRAAGLAGWHAAAARDYNCVAGARLGGGFGRLRRQLQQSRFSVLDSAGYSRSRHR